MLCVAQTVIRPLQQFARQHSGGNLRHVYVLILGTVIGLSAPLANKTKGYGKVLKLSLSERLLSMMVVAG